MSEFRPLGIYYDALSGEFTPKCDPQQRKHTLARLAFSTCEKGDDCSDAGLDMMLYYPSWAENSFCQVDQPEGGLPFDTQVMISEAYGRWPREINFTHHRSNPAMGSEKHRLVITERNFEAVHPLEMGDALQKARQEVAEIAEDFYAKLKIDE